MEKHNLPKIPSAVNTEVLTVRVDTTTKADLDRLKTEYRVDVGEWVRQLIRRELKTIKAS